MGSIFAPKTPSAPPPQEKEELLDFIDEVSGIEQRVVTRADGTREIVRKELPLTDEEQAFRDEIQARVEEASRQVSDLSGAAAAIDIPEFAEQVQELENVLRKSTDRSFKVASEAQEETLSRRGLSDSTTATQQRRDRLRQRAEAEERIDLSVRAQAEELRSAALARQQNLLATATGQQQNVFGQQLASSQFGAGLQSAQLGSDLAIAQANQQAALQAANQRLRAASIGAQTFGSIVGAAGTAAGGFFSG